MHPAVEARAPKMRNRDAMRLWFDAWNADNERARAEYDFTMSLLEAPKLCRKKLHLNAPDALHCRHCRNVRERARRRSDQPWSRLTPDQKDEVVRLYVEEMLSIRMVAQELGFRMSAVRSTLHQRKVPIRSQSEAISLRWSRGKAA